MASTERIGDLCLRSLGPHDVGAGALLSAEAGWNQNEADWRWILANGVGWGFHDRQGYLGATSAIIPYNDEIAWICMVLVTASWRRRGIATALLNRCVGHAESRGWVAGLDATEAGRQTYLPLGFKDCFPVVRYLAAPAGLADDSAGAGGLPAVAMRKMTGDDLRQVTDLDAAAAGVDRPALIAHLFARAPEMAWVATEGERIAGFCLGRDGRDADQVGPVVADQPEAAIALTRTALRSRSDPRRGVYVDAAAGKKPFNRWLTETGFTEQRTFMRMLKGRSAAPGDQAPLYAIAGPELS